MSQLGNCVCGDALQHRAELVQRERKGDKKARKDKKQAVGKIKGRRVLKYKKVGLELVQNVSGLYVDVQQT